MKTFVSVKPKNELQKIIENKLNEISPGLINRLYRELSLYGEVDHQKITEEWINKKPHTKVQG